MKNIMRKKFYVWNGDFGNVYNLFWAETPEQSKRAEKNGATRITRRQAEKRGAEENDRRKDDSNGAGYADYLSFPGEGDEGERDLGNNRSLYVDGYIVKRKADRAAIKQGLGLARSLRPEVS